MRCCDGDAAFVAFQHEHKGTISTKIFSLMLSVQCCHVNVMRSNNN